MENNNSLNRVFATKNFKNMNSIRDLLNSHFFDAVSYVDINEQETNQRVFEELYRYLKDEYRNEYFYKNTLINKKLLGVHSTNTTTALSQISIGNSKADLILINGKAVVYEIKSGLDNLDRLPVQLSDYYKAFDHVTVLTDEKNVETLEKMLGNGPVGIDVLTSRCQIHVVKDAKQHIDDLDLRIMFRILNKTEFENILLKTFGKLPHTTQVKYYDACEELFCSLKTEECYGLYLEQLKKRHKTSTEEFKKVPYELKSAIYFADYRLNDYRRLFRCLNLRYGEEV